MPLPFPTFNLPVAEVVFPWSATAGPSFDAVNVMHFVATDSVDPLTTGDLVALGNSLIDWAGVGADYADHLRDVVHEEYGLSQLIITSEQDDNPIQSVITAGVGGAVSGDLLPRETSLVASLRTGFTGKNRRGRVYLPGMSETNNTNATPTSGFTAQVEDVFDELIVNLPGDSGTRLWSLCVASHTTGEVNVVTNVIADSEWDTQRRRSA